MGVIYEEFSKDCAEEIYKILQRYAVLRLQYCASSDPSIWFAEHLGIVRRL